MLNKTQIDQITQDFCKKYDLHHIIINIKGYKEFQNIDTEHCFLFRDEKSCELNDPELSGYSVLAEIYEDANTSFPMYSRMYCKDLNEQNLKGCLLNGIADMFE